MNRAVVVLLLLIANAIVSPGRGNRSDSAFLDWLGRFSVREPAGTPSAEPPAVDPCREIEPPDPAVRSLVYRTMRQDDRIDFPLDGISL